MFRSFWHSVIIQVRRSARFKLLVLVSAVLLGAGRTSSYGQEPLTLRVSPDVVNSGPLTVTNAESKVWSLDDAIAIARSMIYRRPVEIELSSGIYRRVEPIRLDNRDSGTSKSPFVIRSAPGSRVVISGTRTVPADLIRNPTSFERLGMDAGASDHIKVIDLPRDLPLPTELSRGLPFPSRAASLEVYQDGQVFDVARWPDYSYARAQTVLPSTDMGTGPTLVSSPDRIGRWSQERGLWVGGYLTFDWLYETARVVGTTKWGGLKLSKLGTHYPVRPSARYFVYNSLAELTRPGEYIVERDQRKIYVWPVKADIAALPLELSVATNLLTIKGAQHVRVEGIAFEGARGDAVRVDTSTGVVLADCLVANVGGNGIVVVQGADNRIERAVIVGTGETAVVLSGGDRNILTPGNHVLAESVIKQPGRLARTYRPAVLIEGVGQQVLSSVLFDAPHAAIIFRGNDHVIALNEIYDVVKETSDAGAIYAGRDWTARGTIIRDNWLHGIVPVQGIALDGKPYETKGIYLDDFLSGTVITGNYFEGVMSPVFIGGGRDNRVHGNTFIASLPFAVQIDGRGLTWAAAHVYDESSTLRQSLKAVPYQGTAYRSRYPRLPSILEDEPEKPKYNAVSDNCFIGVAAVAIENSLIPMQDVVDRKGKTQPCLQANPTRTAPRVWKYNSDLRRGSR